MDFNAPLPSQPGSGLVMSIGGVLPIKNLSQLHAEEKAQAQIANSRSYITNLAGHVKSRWGSMRDHKQQDVEPRLLSCLRQRRGEYDPEILAQIKQQGGSAIYLMLSSNKARAASSWIRDVMNDAGEGAVPYILRSTPVPELSPQFVQRAYQSIRQEMAVAASVGINPSEDELEQYLIARKEVMVNELREHASRKAENMKRKMDDQMVEGGFLDEFHKFVDDLVTFPYAVFKGPIVKRRKALKWIEGMDGQYTIDLQDELAPTWERVDPFMIYWAKHSAQPDDGEMIERHRLSREDLSAMIGVEGYSDAAIRAVLDEYGAGGLHEWLWIDTEKAEAEGKDADLGNDSGLIDALQYWGSVQGKMLLDWGLDDGVVDDPLKDYPVEVWLVGDWVIKAVVNPEALGRKPYYKASYEEVPGAWLGNSPMDLIRDCQAVCNAAARALVNNMGIASGPQVWVNVDRLPQGEEITQMYPWKIWQFTSDMANNSAPPVDFFQPNSLASELMAIYERFHNLADDYSGIPRYLVGGESPGGAGRTASGMSMMMNNAGKAIKQVISNVDRHVIQPAVERLWMWNMRYSDDPDLKGDVKVVAKGANALVVKEAAAQRRNEMMQIALTNPMAQQIMGVEGVAALLREQAKTLDMNADRIVPSPEIAKARAMVAQAQAMIQQAQMAQQGMLMQPPPGQGGSPQAGPTTDSGQRLADGTPITDTFSPMRTS